MSTGTDVTALLRQEVTGLRVRESRRVFDAALYVGHLAGPRNSFVIRARDVPAIDRAVRVDVVDALVTQVPGEPECAWLTRPGDPYLVDTDVEWMQAAREGFAMHGLTLGGFWVVTPSGWCDVRSGRPRHWRPRPG